MSAIDTFNSMFVPQEARLLSEAHKKVARELQQSNAEVKEVARDVISLNQRMRGASFDGRLGSRLDVYA